VKTGASLVSFGFLAGGAATGVSGLVGRAGVGAFAVKLGVGGELSSVAVEAQESSGLRRLWIFSILPEVAMSVGTRVTLVRRPWSEGEGSGGSCCGSVEDGMTRST